MPPPRPNKGKPAAHDPPVPKPKQLTTSVADDGPNPPLGPLVGRERRKHASKRPFAQEQEILAARSEREVGRQQALVVAAERRVRPAEGQRQRAALPQAASVSPGLLEHSGDAEHRFEHRRRRGHLLEHGLGHLGREQGPRRPVQRPSGRRGARLSRRGRQRQQNHKQTRQKANGEGTLGGGRAALGGARQGPCPAQTGGRRHG